MRLLGKILDRKCHIHVYLIIQNAFNSFLKVLRFNNPSIAEKSRSKVFPGTQNILLNHKPL